MSQTRTAAFAAQADGRTLAQSQRIALQDLIRSGQLIIKAA